MKAEGFPKKLRLSKRIQYLALQRGGRRVHTRNFLILWRVNGLAISRLGITVTKRVANAVGRNRVKRRVRQVFRTAGESLPPGLDLVVIAKKGSPLLETAQVGMQFRQALALLEKEIKDYPAACRQRASLSKSTNTP